jgi:hypothetical protein
MLRLSHLQLGRKLLTLSALCIVPASMHAATIFSEDFESATPGLGLTVAGQFTAINGTNIDVLGPGTLTNYGFECLSPEFGQCVDLGGSGTTASNDGDLTATVTAPSAGIYFLSFQLIGNSVQQSPPVTASVTLGDYSQSFTLLFQDTTDGIVVNVPVTLAMGANTIEIKNTDSSGSANGPILDNVLVLDALPTPEPTTALLLGSALLLASAFRKRSVR